MSKDYTQNKASATTNKKGIDFVRLAPLMGGLSLILTIGAIGLLIFKGLNYGIDFSGGTEVQVKFDQPVTAEQVRASVDKLGLKEASVQSIGDKNEFIIRLGTPAGQTEKEINQTLVKQIDSMKADFAQAFGLKAEGVLRVDTVGPQVGNELKKNGFLAALYSFILILIYVSIRFDYAYAPGAVLSLLHDTLIVLGVFSLLDREFNVQIMAAILTLIGYSLNDTIVTFDRIRETLPKMRGVSLYDIINQAINDMLSRTILTGFTTFAACLGLYLYGGGVIEQIAFTLMLGVAVGMYSSIYVAAPLILVYDKMMGGAGKKSPASAPMPRAAAKA
jgi:preprotein translocase subunit SecF